MLWLLTAAVVVIVVWMLRKYLPVNDLIFINPEDLKQIADENTSLKMLDVRDAVDYLDRHVSGSVNISLGRLPFVWSTELSTTDGVLIFGENSRQSKQAARILKRFGFSKMYVIRHNVGRKNWQESTGAAAVCCSDCCH